MKKKYAIVFLMMCLYNMPTSKSEIKQCCDSCNIRLEESRKEVIVLEAQCRHFREEISKWMKLYYDSQEKILEYTRQSAKTISELTTKILQLNDKYGGK